MIMKRLTTCILALVLVLLLATGALGASMNVVTEGDCLMYYAGYEPLPDGWNAMDYDVNSWRAPGFCLDSQYPYLRPDLEAPFAGSQALWLFPGVFDASGTPDYNDPCMIGDQTHYASYLYRKTFDIPAEATNISATIYSAGDNYQYIYLNGNYVCGPKNNDNGEYYDLTGNNFTSGQYQTASNVTGFHPGKNLIAAEVKNGNRTLASVGHGWTGLLWYAKITYTLPAVSIDVKPGNDQNVINASVKGDLPVAILGSADFDINQIVLDSVKLNGAGMAVKGSRKTARMVYTVNDVNGDGFTDMVCYFNNQSLGLTSATTSVALQLELNNGRLFEGFDTVKVSSK